MGMFDQAKDMYKMQKQAKEIKKKLKNIHIEGESSGIKMTMTAEQEIISLDIPPEMLQEGKKTTLEKAIIDCFQKCTKKAQEVAAAEMRAIMGDMGLPGLGQ